MRDFHQRKSNLTMSGQDGESASNHSKIATCVAKQTYKFRLGPWGLQERPTPPRRMSRRRRPMKPLSAQNEEESSLSRSTAQPPSRAGEDQLTPLQIPSGQERLTKYPYIPAGRDRPTKDEQVIVAVDEVEQRMACPSKSDSFVQEILHHDPGIGFGDPFNANPVLASRRLQSLLYYCKY